MERLRPGPGRSFPVKTARHCPAHARARLSGLQRNSGPPLSYEVYELVLRNVAASTASPGRRSSRPRSASEPLVATSADEEDDDVLVTARTVSRREVVAPSCRARGARVSAVDRRGPLAMGEQVEVVRRDLLGAR